jgi:hypothetical protein
MVIDRELTTTGPVLIRRLVRLSLWQIVLVRPIRQSLSLSDFHIADTLVEENPKLDMTKPYQCPRPNPRLR